MSRLLLLLPLLCCGCQLVQKRAPDAPPILTPHDPNTGARPDGSGGEQAASPVQHAARTTLLEENEHLRTLLTEALAEKRSTQQELRDAQERNDQLEKRLAEQEDSIVSLTERLAAASEESAALRQDNGRLERERLTLAEMYALEKRQRLAFEKELLEREIAERTVSKKDP